MYPEISISGIEGYELLTLVLQMLFVTSAVAMVISAVMYVLKSIGLYSVAKRRRIKHPWLAWIPLGDYWILGSIADQYRYVSRNEVCSRRKVLLVMFAISQFIGVAASYLSVELMAIIAESARQISAGYDFSLLVDLGSTLALLLTAGLAALIVSVVAMVFYFIALHDYYKSCYPDQKSLFLVLSILFPVTIPFFIFGCRKGEKGMPPRKVRPQTILPPAEPEEKPVEEVAEEPVEEPAEEVAEEPVEEPVEVPAEEPETAPVEAPAEEPETVPAEAPTEESKTDTEQTQNADN